MTQPGYSISKGEWTFSAGNSAASLLTPTHPHKGAATEAEMKHSALIEQLSHATMPENSEGQDEQSYQPLLLAHCPNEPVSSWAAAVVAQSLMALF